MSIQTKYLPNPNATATNKVALFRPTYVCDCGSTNIAKSYVMWDGEVEGITLTCRDCGERF